MDIKLIIWDLDDTLWQGTLAEGDQLQLNLHRAEFIRKYNRCGLVSAVCSKNDYLQAKKQLEQFHLWDEFVAFRIDFVPKGAVIRQLIDEMQLRPVNVLFVDDNPHNLHEVKSLVPDIQVLNAALPECDIYLQELFDKYKHISKSRVEEYRILQAKLEDRQQQAVSNEAFLKASDIHIAFAVTMENLDFKERIVELINRSNQLNYTQSRTDIETLTNKMMDIMAYESCSVFVWDKYGYYGLVGFALIDRHTQVIEHFAFSCRVMHMGIEAAVLKKISVRHPSPDMSKFKIPLTAIKEDWLIEEKFYDEVRKMIREKENTINQKEIKIKITYSCMSAGIAYYSKYRDVIDFDGARFDQLNRYLCFSNLLSNQDEVSKQYIPPVLIYGASIDYYEAGWMADVLPLDNQNFVKGIEAFCQYFSPGNTNVLVVLPPENLPDSCYRQSSGHTRERTAHFNRLWRASVSSFPFISLLELTGFATVADLSDPAHYHAGFMQKIAGKIDAWYESIVNVEPETKKELAYSLLQ